LRELVWMFAGHQKTAWVHTTHLICTFININRGKEDQPVKFNDVYPFAEKHKPREPDELDRILLAAHWAKLSEGQKNPKRVCPG
jgi:hypothetical protein